MITRVRGVRVGHWTDPVGRTGCTVVLCPPGSVASGEVRGGAPGTRETDLLRPGRLVREANAFLLAGGSAFGLAAADGVVRFCEERGLGFDTPLARVPIVPAAVLYDLAEGDPTARPDAAAGHAAAVAAEGAPDGAEVPEGAVGAGTGATVAKTEGPHRARAGGIGTASAVSGDLVVGAIVAVNAFGSIVDDEGGLLAGPVPEDEAPPPPDWWPGPGSPPPATNTTIGVVATNANLSRERAHLLALAGHEGLLRAIRPAHTMWDGDTVFSLATRETDAPQATMEELAEHVMAEAIRRAVRVTGAAPPGEGGDRS